MFLTQDEESGEITFYMKGADIVMRNVVQYNDWMDEEVSYYVLLLQFIAFLSGMWFSVHDI